MRRHLAFAALVLAPAAAVSTGCLDSPVFDLAGTEDAGVTSTVTATEPISPLDAGADATPSAPTDQGTSNAQGSTAKPPATAKPKPKPKPPPRGDGDDDGDDD